VDRVPPTAPVEVVSLLEPVPESAREAREAVQEAVRDAGCVEHVETATLLTSEVVTNAIVHAGTAIELRVQADRSGVRVSVGDESNAVPTQRHYGRTSTTGRGMAMVELLATNHGMVSTSAGGKTVWFELGTPPADSPVEGREPGLGEGNPRPAALPIILRNVPVPLTQAWQQHADALLREYTLSRWDDDDTMPEAAADDRAAHEGFAILAAAFEPVAEQDWTVPSAEVEFAVDVEQLHNFAALDVVLDHIIGLAEQGLTLAPPIQPEIRTFRRWVVDQVTSQATGGPVEAWTGLAADPEPANGSPLLWDVTHIESSAEAAVAADDLNRIVAVSPAAKELLGWDDDLVGRRIVTIVPPRYREMHIAAFTLNQLTGEQRILDREVPVEALRRDGSEVAVLLRVQRGVADDGRSVYTATLRRP
jgi:PAS domain S-box-containing protein